MGFEELGDDELIRWLGGWIANVAGTVDVAAAGDTENAGKITVSIQGDLVRLELNQAAKRMQPDSLSRAIERGYVQAYREALHQVGQVFDRIEQDVAGNAVLRRRIRRIREEHRDRSGLRRMLKRQAQRQEPTWDPAADPLRHRI
ncbi:hypothetical protein [Mycobacterium talmoniae]|nr:MULTISPECIES: hypothetical protein [Mycobacterium]PQM44524.1 hypothetical protein C1Y40_05318 [Mycobacterium talmoniae]TDH48069.1 hypothetical protein E2F47_25255 [Mycobacterium eburneum]